VPGGKHVLGDDQGAPSHQLLLTLLLLLGHSLGFGDLRCLRGATSRRLQPRLLPAGLGAGRGASRSPRPRLMASRRGCCILVASRGWRRPGGLVGQDPVLLSASSISPPIVSLGPPG
jgi:hypothetical protein